MTPRNAVYVRSLETVVRILADATRSVIAIATSRIKPTYTVFDGETVREEMQVLEWLRMITNCAEKDWTSLKKVVQK